MSDEKAKPKSFSDRFKFSIPNRLFLLIFIMFFVFFASAGLNDPIFVILPILIVAGMGVYISNKIFLGNFGTTQKMFISYLIFFLISFTFINTSVATSFKGNVPQVTAPVCANAITPNPSTDPVFGGIIDAFNSFTTFFRNLFVAGSCALTYWIGLLSSMFGLSSSIKLVNDVLIVPMLFLGVFVFLELKP